MATFTGTVYSASLRMETQLAVCLPQDRAPTRKTLILLHGISDNATAWLRNTQAAYWANQYGVAMVMPEVQRSFYLNQRYGLCYGTYITKELPTILASLFNISTNPADLMIAGLSMGGYGALRAAFLHPDRFAVCAAFSPLWNIRDFIAADSSFAHFAEFGPDMSSEWTAAFGTEFAVSADADMPVLAEKAAKASKKPRFYLACGTEDILYSQSRSMRRYFAALPFDFSYEEWQGDHTWTFWNEALRRTLVHFS